MLQTIFLGCIGIGIGLGALTFGYGGVMLMIAGLCAATFCWGCAMSCLKENFASRRDALLSRRKAEQDGSVPNNSKLA